MLFLGTQKYPEETDYEKFLSKYGGFSNAYTDMEDTNYFFSVTTDASECFSDDGETTKTTTALEGALDRLAQFFIAPTFDPHAVDRELRAINSEYVNGKTNDSWRTFQMLKSVADQRHPFSKFGCGNYETLLTEPGQEKLLAELHRFWRDFYQTYNLRLAVVGHGSLDALQKTVEETFGQIPYSDGAPRRIRDVPGRFFTREHAVYGGSSRNPDDLVQAFGPNQRGLVRQVIPFTEARNVKIYFATPPLEDPALRPSMPYRALSHFLGHEAPGSLHALLSEQGYLMGLTSGMGLDTSDFSLFSLNLALTPKGMKAKDKVLDLVFQWIAVLRSQTDEKLAAYHDELRQIGRMNFRFRENTDPADFCTSASEMLFAEDLDPARILISSTDTTEYDASVARAFLDRLRPENCMITVINSDLDVTDGGDWKTEKWYGAQYTEEKLSAEQMIMWENPSEVDPRLRAPDLNKYIPTDFSLRCDDDGVTHLEQQLLTKDDPLKESPSVLIDRPNLRLWHKMDRQWRVPKTFIKASLLSPSVYQSPRSMTLNRIFQRVLNDDLNSFVYDASLAGCGYRVSCTPSGYRISVRGYSEKLAALLDTLTTRMLSLIQEMQDGNEVLREKFEKAKQGLLRETKNYRLDAPYEVANYNSRLLIEENVWYLDNYVGEMEGEEAKLHPLTMEECANVAKEAMVGRIRCEALCMGNIAESEAQNVANVLDRHFLDASRTLTEVETPRFRSMKIPTRAEAIRIFGPSVNDRPAPVVYQELAYTDTEENNAVEYIIQAGSELELGYEGLAVLDLITHMAYNSAFNRMRTQEQLGYIVSAHARKTVGGAWGMSIVVQSSVALPEKLEERCEAWLEVFRQELEALSPERIANEASAVASQFLETDTKLSQEVNRAWGEILNTEGMSDNLRTPAFDRVQLLADELTMAETETNGAALATKKRKTAEELKERVLEFFDDHFAPSSPQRRVMSSRVYSHKSKEEYEISRKLPGVLSSYADMRSLKQFLSSWPSIPYWRIEKPTDPIKHSQR